MSKNFLKIVLSVAILNCFMNTVFADVAPEPFPIVHEPSFLPVILILAVVIVALFLVRKYRKK